MLLYIFSFLFLVTITQAIDDTPFTNFTWQLDRVKGYCRKPPHFYINQVVDEKQAEGRWYGVEVSYKEDQVKTLSCYHWDTFFDKEGIMHDFYYINENGQLKLLVDKADPSSRLELGYKLQYKNDFGPNPAYQNVYTTLFDIDRHYVVRYNVQCFGDDTEARDAEIGYRSIDMAYDSSIQVDVKQMLIFLKGRVGRGHFPVRKIAHENCTYQPIMKNPYK